MSMAGGFVMLRKEVKLVGSLLSYSYYIELKAVHNYAIGALGIFTIYGLSFTIAVACSGSRSYN